MCDNGSQGQQWSRLSGNSFHLRVRYVSPRWCAAMAVALHDRKWTVAFVFVCVDVHACKLSEPSASSSRTVAGCEVCVSSPQPLVW